MSRAKAARRRKEALAHKEEWPIVVFMWIFGLAIVAYLVSRAALDGMPHPYHWLSGVAGGILGIPLGWLWFRWRGDVL
jgi:hypothetical protein